MLGLVPKKEFEATGRNRTFDGHNYELPICATEPFGLQGVNLCSHALSGSAAADAVRNLFKFA